MGHITPALALLYPWCRAVRLHGAVQGVPRVAVWDPIYSYIQGQDRYNEARASKDRASIMEPGISIMASGN